MCMRTLLVLVFGFGFGLCVSLWGRRWELARKKELLFYLCDLVFGLIVIRMVVCFKLGSGSDFCIDFETVHTPWLH